MAHCTGSAPSYSLSAQSICMRQAGVSLPRQSRPNSASPTDAHSSSKSACVTRSHRAGPTFCRAPISSSLPTSGRDSHKCHASSRRVAAFSPPSPKPRSQDGPFDSDMEKVILNWNKFRASREDVKGVLRYLRDAKNMRGIKLTSSFPVLRELATAKIDEYLGALTDPQEEQFAWAEVVDEDGEWPSDPPVDAGLQEDTYHTGGEVSVWDSPTPFHKQKGSGGFRGPSDMGQWRAHPGGSTHGDYDVVLAQANEGASALSKNRPLVLITFQVHYETYLGQELYMGGSHSALGEWDVERAVPMRWTEGNNWIAEVPLPSGSVVFYKYLVKECGQDEWLWQPGANNTLAVPVAERAFEAKDLWNGAPCRSAGSRELNLTKRLEEAEQARFVAEAEAARFRAMAEAALAELVSAREDAARATELLHEIGLSLADPDDPTTNDLKP